MVLLYHKKNIPYITQKDYLRNVSSFSTVFSRLSFVKILDFFFKKRLEGNFSRFSPVFLHFFEEFGIFLCLLVNWNPLFYQKTAFYSAKMSQKITAYFYHRCTEHKGPAERSLHKLRKHHRKGKISTLL